ncbi:hypothetical protein chiPu_0006348 [Chiloscyllium punctatum]|uniref:Uncharacterized protein n=1 Tax=Chiloscyllium punctatum TaxID=137246 RepID=A0A401SBZ4_CHIPU|nr:hypothetical protein [Chiloscyllium punctatum]
MCFNWYLISHSSDDYMKLVDKLRETKLTPYQMPTCTGFANSHNNQYLLPCEHIVSETHFIGKDQEGNFDLKCPQCQVEYFISWHDQTDQKHIYSAVNTEARSTPQKEYHFKENKENEATNKTSNDESNCHLKSVRPNVNHDGKNMKPLSPSGSPACYGKYWKRYPFNPFSSVNQYHVLDCMPDPQECQEPGKHDSRFLPNTPLQQKRESDLNISAIGNTGQLG